MYNTSHFLLSTFLFALSLHITYAILVQDGNAAKKKKGLHLCKPLFSFGGGERI
jgi:hypothetical protein